MKNVNLFGPKVTPNALEDMNVLTLISMVRKGIKFNLFDEFAEQSPFSMHEWSGFLHLSERTMLRYKNEQKTFDVPQSEKIVEIYILYKKGIEVFGDSKKFNSWLETENLALGGVKPKTLLDSSFGINLLDDELGRIEYGVLA
ncbi:DUF2384 domain-containing protein [Emticicia sp. CRIBPO]|uniref:type II RES/Xre toxin-antitoxin system antitoxin n=1 Tax=Emticicia sp. CRIBPO TaxID=2683258 RepID=UPI001412EF30|nr:antitoxin Xre/MbcA/ParS toxin-binding domain-containing protein [Emticicia sp. CRIBPO]NBA87443.1 DUF2384 domain-containing protein [Emticicia sp. CRIBPO]